MTVFTMFFIELMASRFEIFGSPDLDFSDPTKLMLAGKEGYSDNAVALEDGKLWHQETQSMVSRRSCSKSFN